MITVVDYDAGNVGSVVNIVRKAGGQAHVSRDPEVIAAADKLILPGVGHFARAMERLHGAGMVAALNEAVISRKAPILGICLGMQLFSKHSEEGDAEGLGWVDARTVQFRFEPGSALKSPHMGWNTIEPTRADPLLEALPEDPRFYFVHSYYVTSDNDAEVLARTTHGAPFVSAVARDNIWGTQFHPEKSHRYGLGIIRNFVEKIG
ncbi:MAG TPA: imidazole glycerol phosphate synthase subunit HisH [Caulobacteraceae bacterium]